MIATSATPQNWKKKKPLIGSQGQEVKLPKLKGLGFRV
jgi:hypothetical protein